MSLLCRNIFSKLERCVGIASRFSTVAENQVPQTEKVEPIISTTKTIENGKFFHVPRQVWLDSLKTIPDKKIGIVSLHPDIFAAQPRLDIIHENIRWQRMYKFVVCYCFFFISRILFLCTYIINNILSITQINL